jgi:hypothetical protein
VKIDPLGKYIKLNYYSDGDVKKKDYNNPSGQAYYKIVSEMKHNGKLGYLLELLVDDNFWYLSKSMWLSRFTVYRIIRSEKPVERDPFNTLQHITEDEFLMECVE